MKKFVFALAALASTTLASPAFAAEGDVTGTVYINGEVANRCQFTTDNKTISLGELTGTDGKLDASVVNGQTETLVGWCNGTAAEMSVEADPIVNTSYTGSAVNGFTTTVNYTATANANSMDADDDSASEGPGSAVNVGIFTGDIDVTLSDAGTDGGLLVAGSYSGEVRVTLSPTVAPPAQ
jgi:hypothetical protein